MKKNTPLYILLFFLIVVNVFFLYNYLGKGTAKREGRQGNPLGFITKQLKFDDAQMKKLEVINEKHHRKMMRINDGTRSLKDALFSKLSDVNVSERYIDSIAKLIGQKEAELDKEAFHHFRKIEEICVGEQKEKFKSIIKEARGRGAGKKNGPPPEGNERPGPPPHERGQGHRPPPPMGGEHMGPPPNH